MNAQHRCLGFADLPTLLRAMGASTLRNSLFPSSVHMTSGGGEAFVYLPEELATKLLELAPQAGWRIWRVDRPPDSASRQSLSESLAPRLERLDDNRRVGLSGEYAESYLLGAANIEDAQRILRILTTAQLPEIRAQWAVAESADEGAPPFFWCVPAFPPRAAIEIAQGLWYGPVAVSPRQCRVYVEHPFEVPGDLAWMRAIDWGRERAAILLSHSEPRQIAIDLAATRPFLQDLIDVAQVEPLAGPLVIQGVDSPAVPAFSVSLTLSQVSRRPSFGQYIEALEQDLEARSQALRRLKQRHVGDDQRPWTCVFEPLYVYFEQSGELPRELRRMLVECCDQGLLDSLLYTTAKASPFAAIGADEGQSAHFLLPRSALGTSARDGSHLWMREYAPRHGRTFQLQESWSRQGLRLFLPDDAGQIQLYPDFSPGPTAARKLAAALHPSAAQGRESLYVLFERPAGGVVSCSVQIDALSPFLEACPWSCSAETTVSASPFRVTPGCQELADSISGALDQALDAATADVRASTIAALGNDLRQLDELLASELRTQAVLTNAESLLQNAVTEVRGLLQAGETGRLTRRRIQSMRDQLARLDTQLQNLPALTQRLP